MLKSIIIFVAILTTTVFVSVAIAAETKTGIDSGKDLLMVVNIPTNLDDPQLISQTETYSHDTSGYCVGTDGNPVQMISSFTEYDLDVYISELDFWNMNSIRVSAKEVDEDTGMVSDGYHDISPVKNPGNQTIRMRVGYKDCYGGYPDSSQTYYDSNLQAFVCGPLIGGGCWDDINITGEALISLEPYRRVK